MRCQERYFCCLLIALICMLVGLTVREILHLHFTPGRYTLSHQEKLPEVVISENTSTVVYKSDCRTHSCFDIFKCNPNSYGQYSVHVYPEKVYFSEDGESIFPSRSSEFREIINAIKKSPSYTDDPYQACLLFPSSDLLSDIPLKLPKVSAALSSLSCWNDGQNHIIFNMAASRNKQFPEKGLLEINTEKAIIAGANFHSSNFRRNFDISIPVFNTFTNKPDITEADITKRRKQKLLTLLESYAGSGIDKLLTKVIGHNLILILEDCEDVSFPDSKTMRCNTEDEFDYPDVLKYSTFCFIAPSITSDMSVLLDALMMGCIPIILMDGSILPFSEVLDWSRATIQIHQVHLKTLPALLKTMSRDELVEKQLQGFHIWKNYFSTLQKITLTTINIIANRISAHKMKKYEDWNDVIPLGKDGRQRGQRIVLPPLFFGIQPSPEEGFTAVILTYNRIKMLHTLMKRLAKCKSLAKIVVVWNNVKTAPPAEPTWPNLDKPWVLIRQKTNRLSNRFFPYNEIETQAVLAIDDDILMLTSDELEFAFQTWLEFPDRLVGFPGRFHLLVSDDKNHQRKFRYESAWSNDVSMVLTGAAFYHKIYNYYYTYVMPAAVRSYVDVKMNCEDIAMNFLIANLTREAPIKVTARKRFKCSQCYGNESLWSESSHFLKRSECLSVFTKLFGYMPLKSVEFRADPVLFHEDVPNNLKRFRDVGMI